MRPSPDRLILARYPHRITVPVRFGDLDPLGHVNNVATGISRIGASSYTSASALFRGETCIGVCDTVMVNTCDGVSTPLPEEARAALGRYLLKPQEGEAAAE